MAEPTAPEPGQPGSDPTSGGQYRHADEPGPAIGGPRRGGPDPDRATPPPPLPPQGGAPAAAAPQEPAAPAAPVAGAPVSAGQEAEPGYTQISPPPRREKHVPPTSGAASAAGPTGASAGPTGGATPPPRPRSADPFSAVIDQIGYLLMDLRDWARQESEYIMRAKVAKPMTEVGVTIGAYFAAVTLLIIGMLFIATAGIVWLSFLIGVPLAFLTIGVVILIGSGVFLAIKVNQLKKSMDELQKVEKLHNESRPPEPVPTGRKAEAPKPQGPQHAPPVPDTPPGG